MQRFRIAVLAATVCFCLSSLSLSALGQQPSSFSLLAAPDTAGGGYVNGTTPASAHGGPFSGLGIGVQVGLLGAGVQVATPIASRMNLRVGGNILSFSDSGSTSGVNYTANLRFRSAQAGVDWFPWGRSFHISPGALVYDGNQVTGNALIPAGSSFTLNGTSYVSDPADPANGSGSLQFAKAAPMVTVGWGNLVPRGEHHVSFPFEMGFAYLGEPKTVLSFTGSVCDSGMQGCESIASDPSAQANVAAEQAKFEKDARYARFFPILSQGFAFRF